MSPEEYAKALEAERKARNDRAKYFVRTGASTYPVCRRTGSGCATHVTDYVTLESAQLAADFLNRLKEDEA